MGGVSHNPKVVRQPLGLVVAFDGIEGAGKSIVATRVRELLPKNLRVAETRLFGSGTMEPDAPSALAGTLYRIALGEEAALDEVERQLVFTVAARHHFRVRLPALRADNDLVLSHRSSLTPLAYGSAFDQKIESLVRWAVTPLAREDLVLWLDVDPAIAESRRVPKVAMGGHAQTSSRFQAEVNGRFGKLASERPWAIRLDASQPLSEVVVQAGQLITRLVGDALRQR